MKTTTSKLLVLFISGLLIALPNSLLAQPNPTPAAISLTAGTQYPIPVPVGCLVTNAFTASVTDPDDTNCEILVNSYSFSPVVFDVTGTNTVGSCGTPDTDGNFNWSWTPGVESYGTQALTAYETNDWNVIDCNESNYDVYASGSVGFNIEVVGAVSTLDDSGGNFEAGCTNEISAVITPADGPWVAWEIANTDPGVVVSLLDTDTASDTNGVTYTELVTAPNTASGWVTILAYDSDGNDLMGCGIATFSIYVNSLVTNCIDGYVTLTNAGPNPANVLPRTQFTITAHQIISNALLVASSDNDVSASCYAITNIGPAPTVISNWWKASGPGGYTNQGGGLSATITTSSNSGCGTVTFYVRYKNNTPCDSNVYDGNPFGISYSVAQISTNCYSGSLSLTNGTISPPNGYPGTSFNASVSVFTNKAAIVVSTNWPCNNVTVYGTNYVVPTTVSNWWTASAGSYSTNGIGVSASFMPTNSGCGTVTFYVKYKNNTPCDTNVYDGNPYSISFSVAQISTNCNSGSLSLTNGTISPPNGYPGTSFNASVSVFTNNAAIVVSTNWPCSTNAATYGTNFVSPTTVSNWWTASVGSYSTNGTGLSASFEPTNSGCGTVTFYVKYKNNTPCDTNVYDGNPYSISFSVAQISTNCYSGSLSLTNGTISPTNACLGSSFSASVNIFTNKAMVVVSTNWPCSTNAATYGTNYVAPTIVSNWWTVSVGTYSNNGSGLSTGLFTPTNGGSGTVAFYLQYKNNTPCDTNVYSATSVSIPLNVIQITNQCVATTPTNQARTTIGVGEQVNICLVGSPSGTYTWSTSAGSVIPTNGTSTTLTAPGNAATATITVKYAGGSCTLPFDVKEPSGVKMVTDGNYRHIVNVPSIGMEVEIYIMPDSVNFENVSEIEQKANAVADGYFLCQNGQPHDNNPQPFPNTDTVIPVLGTKANAVDHIWSGYCGTTPPFGVGTETITIPWDFRVGTNSWKTFTNLTHSCTFDGSQALNASKDSASWQCNITNQTVWNWQ
jgi:hypothetical protein